MLYRYLIQIQHLEQHKIKPGRPGRGSDLYFGICTRYFLSAYYQQLNIAYIGIRRPGNEKTA